jgi:virulence factor Mce-like protein
VRGPRLLGLLATGAGLAALILAGHPPSLPWQPRLDFGLMAPSFGQLGQNAGVELGGVRVGQVQGLELVHGQALIEVEVDGSYAHLLHADASATIRPHGLLGPQYVDLSGGSRGVLREGAIIPASRVKVAVGLDQVLDALQPDVRQSLKVLIVELGQGTNGRGADVNASLHALGQASGDLTTVTGTLHQHDADLQSVIDSSERLSRSLQYAPLDAQLRDTDRVLSGLAQPSTDAAIGSGIDHTANVLTALDEILNGNSANLAHTLDEAPTTVLRLRTLLAEAHTLVEGVNPSLPALMTAVVETQSAFSGSDANGHYVRILSVLGPCTVGLNLGCAGGPAQGGPPVGGSGATSAAPRASDQALQRALLGNG